MKSIRITFFVGVLILGLFLSPAVLNVNAQDILSPRQQMKSGIAAEDVECKIGLVLMIRTTNGAATCVKSSSSLELSAAGWGSITIDDEESEIIEEEILEDEKITNATMGNQTNHKIIKLSEDLSMGDKEDSVDDTMDKTPLTIGGFDLSFAAPVEGDEDAPITIIEFGDYQCPKCKAWFQNEKSKIASKYITTGKAKLYFLDSAWLGADSISAAQASHCAADQGKFIEYHYTLYNNQKGIQDGWASIKALKQFAADIKIDSEMFNECLDSGVYAERVSSNTQIGSSNGVEGTPYFFIIGPEGDIKKIAGPQPSIVFDAAINSLS